MEPSRPHSTSKSHNFFTILKNTIDIILDRFQGLGIERNVPCICHRQGNAGTLCQRSYRYEDLERRVKVGKYVVECPDTFAEVSLLELLYGIHKSTDEQVMLDIQKGQHQILEELRERDSTTQAAIAQLSELLVRNFTRQWNWEMKNLGAECPNAFFLIPTDGSALNPKDWVSREFELYLICQHPPGPHAVGDGYRLRRAERWWATVSPWLNRLIELLKFGIPMGKAIEGVYDKAAVERMKENIELLEEITKSIPELDALNSGKSITRQTDSEEAQYVIGPALRAVHSFLDEVDRSHFWGGLYKTVTLDGNILWLCNHHRELYETRDVARF